MQEHDDCIVSMVLEKILEAEYLCKQRFHDAATT